MKGIFSQIFFSVVYPRHLPVHLMPCACLTAFVHSLVLPAIADTANGRYNQYGLAHSRKSTGNSADDPGFTLP
jgi:hypothetical protein